MNIVGNSIFLRAMEPEDMENLRTMLNDPELERMLGGWSYPISKMQQQNWYQNVVSDTRNLRWIVARKEDNAFLGMVNLVDIDWKNGCAMHGIRLFPGEEYRHKGYGTDAVNTLMKYAFDELRLHRLETTILEYNTISQALYTKCGWKLEGTKRSAIYRNGRYHNHQIWGIVVSDYRKEEKG